MTCSAITYNSLRTSLVYTQKAWKSANTESVPFRVTFSAALHAAAGILFLKIV